MYIIMECYFESLFDEVLLLIFFRKKCPIAGCPGRVINLSKHLSQCHKYLTVAERKKAIELFKFMKKIQSTVLKPLPKETNPSTKCVDYHRTCSVCDAQKKRIDVHLQKFTF